MARLGSNEGSIYKRADGRWAAVVNLGWQDGKRIRKTFYRKTRGEVKDQLNKALSDHQKALPVTSDRLTTGQFLDSWLVDSVKAAVRPRTFQSCTLRNSCRSHPPVGFPSGSRPSKVYQKT